LWTTFNKAYSLSIILLISAVLISCTAHYVEVDEPSQSININSFSIKLPSDGNWYRLVPSMSGDMRFNNQERFATGGGDDIYWIYFISTIDSWKDEINNEYLLDKTQKYFDNHTRFIFRDKEYGIRDVNYNLQILKGVKDYCVELKYDFTSSKPIIFYMRGFAFRPHTDAFDNSKLNLSDKYYYEVVELHVIEGPYKSRFFDPAVQYIVIFLHVSVNNYRDPELEEKALTFLKNVEFTQDWEKEDVK